MNKAWSDQNKKLQVQLKRKETFKDGIESALLLRDTLWKTALSFTDSVSLEDFHKMPFINAKGYHNKTIAYSLWHIFRIEDCVVSTLILNKQQILFESNRIKNIGTPSITTGNELFKEEISDFSSQLNIAELYEYCLSVKERTDVMLESLTYEDLKRKIDPQYKENLLELDVVSKDENAFWLIDYWCSKDIRGLIKMPLTRHWIMHIEACLRIQSKL